MQLAYSRGVQPESKAQAQLNEWLTNQPEPEFFANTMRAIKIFIAALPDDQQGDARNDLLSYCTRIAEASGGFLGFGSISQDERRTLQQITNELVKNRAEAVQQVLAD